MSHASPAGTLKDGTTFYREQDIAKVSRGEKISTSLKLMPTGDVCLHVQPNPSTRYYGDDTPIMRVSNNVDTGLASFCCKHAAQKADAKSSKKEVICHVIFQGGLSTINLGTFRSHSSGRHWGDKGPMHQTTKG